MITSTIKINERFKKGKAFLAITKTFFDKENDIKIVEKDTKILHNDESFYNPEFEKMVLDAVKSKNNLEINPNELGRSLGFS